MQKKLLNLYRQWVSGTLSVRAIPISLPSRLQWYISHKKAQSLVAN